MIFGIQERFANEAFGPSGLRVIWRHDKSQESFCLRYVPRWRLRNEDSLFIYSCERTPLEMIVFFETDFLLPSSTVTGGLESLTFPGKRVKLNPIWILVVGKLFCEISSITPKGEVVRFRSRGVRRSPIALVFLVLRLGRQCSSVISELNLGTS